VDRRAQARKLYRDSRRILTTIGEPDENSRKAPYTKAQYLERGDRSPGGTKEEVLKPLVEPIISSLKRLGKTDVLLLGDGALSVM
jgi:hypothetical protein